MAYAKITNGEVVEYPYTIGDLRRDNPNTSFPKRIPNEVLSEWGVYQVTVENRPDITERNQVTEIDPEPKLVGGEWVVGWTTHDKTASQIEEFDNATAAAVRLQRNTMLSETDWTQVNDAPVDQVAWAEYRKKLRDITSQPSFPHDAIWPQKP